MHHNLRCLTERFQVKFNNGVISRLKYDNKLSGGYFYGGRKSNFIIEMYIQGVSWL